MTSKFFTTNNYFIDEKVNFLKFENEYKVYNESGEHIGAVMQKISVGQKILRLLLNKAMLPFNLDIVNIDNMQEASISRGWTFFMSTIKVSDADGNAIGTVKQKFKLFKPTFIISDASNSQIAEITGDWKAWNFTIKDGNGNEIGQITKKWAGVMKEIFTTADKYVVSIDPNYSNQKNKKAILACAITIDMVLKESK